MEWRYWDLWLCQYQQIEEGIDKMGDLFKYGLLAVGGYLLYEYFYGTPTAVVPTAVVPTAVNPVSTTTVPPVGTSAGQPGYISDPTPSNTTVVPPTSVASTSLISSSVQDQLQQLADTFVTNTQAIGLNVDQWNYYLAQITGVQLTGAQGEQLILALGETDATRGTIINLSTYLSALNATGLGGLGLGMVRGLGLIEGRVVSKW